VYDKNQILKCSCELVKGPIGEPGRGAAVKMPRALHRPRVIVVPK
jgi:hypothetical protein